MAPTPAVLRRCAISIAIAFLLPVPFAVRVVGMAAGVLGLHWVRYQQIRGWQDKSPEFAPMREHNRKFPEQQWIAVGCFLLLAVVVAAALIGIPLLTGSDFWTWPWDR